MSNDKTTDKPTPARPRARAKTAPVLLYRDYWDEDGARRRAGAVVTVDVATARALIAADKAGRADPLPGEPPRGEEA